MIRLTPAQRGAYAETRFWVAYFGPAEIRRMFTAMRMGACACDPDRMRVPVAPPDAVYQRVTP